MIRYADLNFSVCTQFVRSDTIYVDMVLQLSH